MLVQTRILPAAATSADPVLGDDWGWGPSTTVAADTSSADSSFSSDAGVASTVPAPQSAASATASVEPVVSAPASAGAGSSGVNEKEWEERYAAKVKEAEAAAADVKKWSTAVKLLKKQHKEADGQVKELQQKLKEAEDEVEAKSAGTSKI